MSKLNPPERRDPPHFVDLNEREVAELILRQKGFTLRQVNRASFPTLKQVIASHGLTFTRDVALLRSFRNV